MATSLLKAQYMMLLKNLQVAFKKLLKLLSIRFKTTAYPLAYNQLTNKTWQKDKVYQEAWHKRCSKRGVSYIATPIHTRQLTNIDC